MSETAQMEQGLSRCWQNQGWHVYSAGPCFNTKEQALKYREGYDKAEAETVEYKKTHPWSWQQRYTPLYEFQERWR